MMRALKETGEACAPENVRYTLGMRLWLRRRELGWTQKELAERCGFPYQVISGVERGKQSIYAERLALLACKLGVTSDYLLGLTD
jgi:transcriptional regulator with XRE-family HTH domain